MVVGPVHLQGRWTPELGTMKVIKRITHAGQEETENITLVIFQVQYTTSINKEEATIITQWSISPSSLVQSMGVIVHEEGVPDIKVVNGTTIYAQCKANPPEGTSHLSMNLWYLPGAVVPDAAPRAESIVIAIKLDRETWVVGPFVSCSMNLDCSMQVAIFTPVDIMCRLPNLGILGMIRIQEVKFASTKMTSIEHCVELVWYLPKIIFPGRDINMYGRYVISVNIFKETVKLDSPEEEHFKFHLTKELLSLSSAECIIHNQTEGLYGNDSNVTLFGVVDVNVTMSMAGWWFISLGHVIELFENTTDTASCICEG